MWSNWLLWCGYIHRNGVHQLSNRVMHFPGSRVKLCDFLGKILQKNINSLQIELDTSHLKRLQNRCGIWIVASIGKYISLGNARLLPAKIRPIAFSSSEKNLGPTSSNPYKYI